MSTPAPTPPPTTLSISLGPDQEVGVFADFASLWHAPNTFVLDFIAIKQPEHPMLDANGNPTGANVLETRVASRVRLAPEQVFPLIAALQQQADEWMRETGRSTAPEGWFPPQVSPTLQSDEDPQTH